MTSAALKSHKVSKVTLSQSHIYLKLAMLNCWHDYVLNWRIVFYLLILWYVSSLQKNSAYSFTGCLKNLQLDGQWLSSTVETFGVTPCFEGFSEAGTYFSEEGGYIVLGTFLVFFNGKKRHRPFPTAFKLKCSIFLFKCNTMCVWHHPQLFANWTSVTLHGSLDFLLENSQTPLVFHHSVCMERVWLGEGMRYPQCSCGETGSLLRGWGVWGSRAQRNWAAAVGRVE